MAVKLYRLHGQPALDDPLMIVAFDAWVDAGSAATTAARALVEGGEKIADIAADVLYDYRARRPTLHIDDGRLVSADWPRLPLIHRRFAERDALILTGPEPDYRWQELSAELVALARELTDQFDLWIYAAGDIEASKVADALPDSWQRILDANLVGAYLAVHYSLPLLAPDAHLMFLGGISERLRLPRLSAYATAKAGLEAFVEVLGKEERKRHVTLVRPAAVDTPLWDKVPFKLPPGALDPDEVAERILAAYDEGHRGVLNL